MQVQEQGLLPRGLMQGGSAIKGILYMKLTRSVNVLSQIVLTLGQLANLFAPILNEKQKLGVGLGIGALQIIISNMAQSVNPDGTPATEAYKSLKDSAK